MSEYTLKYIRLIGIQSLFWLRALFESISFISRTTQLKTLVVTNWWVKELLVRAQGKTERKREWRRALNFERYWSWISKWIQKFVILNNLSWYWHVIYFVEYILTNMDIEYWISETFKWSKTSPNDAILRW